MIYVGAIENLSSLSYGENPEKAVHRGTVNMRILALLIMSCLWFQSLSSQNLSWISLFPDSAFIPAFPADAHAHRMKVENIEFTKNISSSMGAMIPFFDIEFGNVRTQASLGASVHFELRPDGQAQISSNDYYVDFLILDVLVARRNYVRFVTGHTSHHLSDNWYEKLQLTTAMRYSRDYLKVLYIYRDESSVMFYAGADFAYIFTIGRRISKPWTLQAGSEIAAATIHGPIELYCAVDSKLRQEAGFAATMTYQVGIKMPMRNSHMVRLAVQFRHGLDERGQFFPQHRMVGTVGLYIDL